MTEAEITKLQKLCSLSIASHCGVFFRTNETIEDKATLGRTAEDWLKSEKTLDQVEKVMNHLHVCDEFPGLTENEYDEIAVNLLLCWNKNLKKTDPWFRVEKYEDYGPTVTFYKLRNEEIQSTTP